MSPINQSSVEPTVPAPTPDLVPATRSRLVARVISGLLLLLCGCVIVVAGMIALVVMHTVGIGKLIGIMILIGMAMVVGGWTRIKN